MSAPIAVHPAAPEHLPLFVAGPDGSDPLLVISGLFLLAAVVGFGILFLRLHTLPERMAHRGQKLQFEIVAVLGLLALFTHMHIFWVAGLLLALIDMPDVTGPLRRIAGSNERIAGLPPGGGDTTEAPLDESASPPAHAAPATPPRPAAQASVSQASVSQASVSQASASQTPAATPAPQALPAGQDGR